MATKVTVCVCERERERKREHLLNTGWITGFTHNVAIYCTVKLSYYDLFKYLTWIQSYSFYLTMKACSLIWHHLSGLWFKCKAQLSIFYVFSQGRKTNMFVKSENSFQHTKKIGPTSSQVKEFCFPQLNKIKLSTIVTITEIILDWMVFMGILLVVIGIIVVCVGFYWYVLGFIGGGIES